jgi:hypothetical protein
VGTETYLREGERPSPSGKVTVQYQFDIDGSHPGAGGAGTLLVNGESVRDR